MALQDSQVQKFKDAPTSERRISQSPLVRQHLTQRISPTPFVQNTLLRVERSFMRAQTFTPPFVLRMGFGAIFAGAGYVLASGDSRNGSGVATAWSLSYFVLEQFSLGLQRSLRLPRSKLSIALSSATAAATILYGTEHFFLDDEESELD
ncbi:hypothetical protein B0F90DRAFT_1813826 [Multifurca ochricompacta]|uniref:Uncharacterized protein n=1 Tax=Multifurca ochricompacta TaxID=376703 RepID=A0AAD4MAV1_9AGAM|nr:hypothetical protein B0F90DRAFT_1813826 [Multifurca ochricompacta]